MTTEPGQGMGDCLRENMPRIGFASCLACIALIGVWVGLMIPLQGGSQAGFHAHPLLFRVCFGACVLFTLAQVPLALALGTAVAEGCPPRALLGVALVLVYVPLNASCYFLNGAILPRIWADPQGGGAAGQAIAASIGMAEPLSVWGSLDVFGYGILGLAWLILGSALWGRSGRWTAAALLMLLVGVTSLLGAVGVFVDLGWLAFFSVIGGVLAFLSMFPLALAFRAEGGAR